MFRLGNGEFAVSFEIQKSRFANSHVLVWYFCICSLFVVARTARKRESEFLRNRLLLFEAYRESDARKRARYTYIVLYKVIKL